MGLPPVSLRTWCCELLAGLLLPLALGLLFTSRSITSAITECMTDQPGAAALVTAADVAGLSAIAAAKMASDLPPLNGEQIYYNKNARI